MESCTNSPSLPNFSHLHLVFPLAHSANYAWGSKYDGTYTSKHESMYTINTNVVTEEAKGAQLQQC